MDLLIGILGSLIAWGITSTIKKQFKFSYKKTVKPDPEVIEQLAGDDRFIGPLARLDEYLWFFTQYLVLLYQNAFGIPDRPNRSSNKEAILSFASPHILTPNLFEFDVLYAEIRDLDIASLMKQLKKEDILAVSNSIHTELLALLSHSAESAFLMDWAFEVSGKEGPWREPETIEVEDDTGTMFQFFTKAQEGRFMNTQHALDLLTRKDGALKNKIASRDAGAAAQTLLAIFSVTDRIQSMVRVAVSWLWSSDSLGIHFRESFTTIKSKAREEDIKSIEKIIRRAKRSKDD